MVHHLQELIVLLGHVIRTSATVLDRRGEADVRRWLREDRGVERVISNTTDDRLRRRDMGLVYFSLGRGTYGGLKMEFLSKTALAGADWVALWPESKFSR